MKILPSVAFSDFSGSAGNVTARKVGENTYLSTRTKHSKSKTPSQAEKRCRFSDTTRGYSLITEEQRLSWCTLASKLGTFTTSTGPTNMTGHNLFVAINSYRNICGKPQLDNAPSYLRPSEYIALNDLWLTPDRIIFTGIQQSVNPNDVLLIEMYPAQSPAETRCWNKTVIVAVKPYGDWGDIDITKEFLEKFGTPLKIGQLVFIKLCWLDSECGYLKWFTLISNNVRESSILHNSVYYPRAVVTTNNIVKNDFSLTENFDYEISPGSKVASNDITAKRIQGSSAGCEFEQSGLLSVFDFERTFQFARATEEYDYLIQCLEVLIQNNTTYKKINLSCRSGIFKPHFETFGTYYITK